MMAATGAFVAILIVASEVFGVSPHFLLVILVIVAFVWLLIARNKPPHPSRPSSGVPPRDDDPGEMY
jgi:hypothetical protein